MKKIITFLTTILLFGYIQTQAANEYYTTDQTLTSGTYTNIGWAKGATITIPASAVVTFVGNISGQGPLINNGNLSATGTLQIGNQVTIGPNASLSVTGIFSTGDKVFFDENSSINLTGGFSPYGGQSIELASGSEVTAVGPVTFNTGNLKMDAGSKFTVTGDVNLSNPNNFIAGTLNITGFLKFNQPVTTMACPGSITTSNLDNASANYAIDGVGFIKVTGTFNSSNALTNSAAIVLDLAGPVGKSNIGAAIFGTASACITTLPISLADFTAARTGNAIKISWITSTEINNQNFVVERTTDGVNYQAVASVATKATNGNSTKDLSYDALDNNPANGNNIYRLKQIDLTGKTTYFNLTSSVIFVSSGSLSVFPNPATSYIQVSGTKSGDHISVYNASGVNILTSESSRIDITSLAEGIYFVQVLRSGIIVNTAKFLKHQ